MNEDLIQKAIDHREKENFEQICKYDDGLEIKPMSIEIDEDPPVLDSIPDKSSQEEYLKDYSYIRSY